MPAQTEGNAEIYEGPQDESVALIKDFLEKFSQKKYRKTLPNGKKISDAVAERRVATALRAIDYSLRSAIGGLNQAREALVAVIEYTGIGLKDGEPLDPKLTTVPGIRVKVTGKLPKGYKRAPMAVVRHRLPPEPRPSHVLTPLPKPLPNPLPRKGRK